MYVGRRRDMMFSRRKHWPAQAAVLLLYFIIHAKLECLKRKI